MIYVKINNTLHPAKVEGRVVDREWNGRESETITLSMTYEEAKEIFANNAKWAVVNQPNSYVDENGEEVTPTPIVHDKSEFSIAGSIKDNRDGTMTVKMGKPTEVETLQAQLANAVTEEELETAYVEGVNSL